MVHLEQRPVWAHIVRQRDSLPLKELAQLHDTTPGEISAALKRTGALQGAAPVVEQLSVLPPEPGEPALDPEDARLRPGSKDAQIANYADLLGKVPDAEVAAKAGVSVRTVASYRSRHDIAGYRGPRRTAGRRGPRRSRIDPYADLLGQVPDRVVAEKAKVSLNAVRNYRVKRGIPAAGRERSAAVAPISQPAKAIATAGQKGWKVVWIEAGTEVTRIVLARTLAEVLSQLGEVGLADKVVRVSLEGVVLDR